MLQNDAKVTQELSLYLHMCDVTISLLTDKLNEASVILPSDCGFGVGASSLSPTSWNPNHSLVSLLTSNAPLRTLNVADSNPPSLSLAVRLCVY